MNELALIQASQNGDRGAFGTLIDNHYKAIYRLAYYYIGKQHEADDICQETFLRAFLKIRSLREGKRFKGWIYAIATNLLRRRIKEISQEKETNSLDCDSESDGKQSAMFDPIERASGGEMMELIYEQLQQMPDYLRLVTILILMDGLSQKDAAGVLNCSEASVSRHLQAAKDRLGSRLKGLV